MVDYLKNNKDLFKDIPESSESVQPTIESKVVAKEDDESRNDDLELSSIDISSYRDEDGLTASKLDAMYLFFQSRSVASRIFIGGVLLLICSLFIYALISLSGYFIFGLAEESEIARQLLTRNFSEHSLRARVAARDLIRYPVAVLPTSSDESKYDFYADITNPNQNYIARFDYYLSINGQKTRISHDFVLPGSNKVLMQLGLESESIPESVALKIENLNWQKINKHKVSSITEYKQNHLDGIEISEINLTTPNSTAFAGGTSKTINVLKFNVKNNTAFDYNSAGFAIKIFDAYGTVVRVERYFVESLPSGSIHAAALNIAGKIGNAKKTEITPDIDIFSDQ